MQPRARLIAAGLATLVLGLIIFFPARVAYQWFAPPELSLSGISGSLWRGQANRARAGGIYLQDLSWRLQPLALFRGQIGYAVEAVPSSGFVDTSVGFGVTGAIQLTDLRGSLPLQPLEQLTRMPGLRGSMNLQFERLVIENGVPVAADGELEVANLVAPKIFRGDVGGYRLEFFTQNSGVMASVEDTNGVVDLAGSLEIAPQGTYQFIGLTAPKATTPPRLRQQMQFLGTANERGQYEVRLEGEL